MKPIKTSILAIASGLLVMNTGSATIVYTENFNSYPSGNLAGQGSPVWNAYGTSSQVGPGAGINTTQTAINGSGTSGVQGAWQSVSLGLGNYTSGTFQMDVMRETGAGSPFTMAGFDNGTTSTGFAFGLSGTTFIFRQGVAGGTSATLYGSPDTTLQVTTGDWYRLTAGLSFTGNNSTITSVIIQNLTTAGSPITAYFDSAATQTSFGLASEETAWNRAYVRTGLSTDAAGYVDNIQLTAVPEPSTWALLAATLATVVVLRHRHRRRA